MTDFVKRRTEMHAAIVVALGKLIGFEKHTPSILTGRGRSDIAHAALNALEDLPGWNAPSTAESGGARNDALEEAANIVDRIGLDWEHDQDFRKYNAAKYLSKNIRALKSTPPAEAQERDRASIVYDPAHLTPALSGPAQERSGYADLVDEVLRDQLASQPGPAQEGRKPMTEETLEYIEKKNEQCELECSDVQMLIDEIRRLKAPSPVPSEAPK